MPSFTELLQDEINLAVRHSLAQDLGLSGEQIAAILNGDAELKQFCERDVTASLIPKDKTVTATVITKQDCIFVGCDWITSAFKLMDENTHINWMIKDGQAAHDGDTLVEVEGNAAAILTAERTALNFAQTLSGTATTVQHYANLLEGFETQILDTRKTIPGMRYGQKYAVQCGGGANHRIGLYDRFLIKENHILAAGSIGNAVSNARTLHPDLLVEVEVEDLYELEHALDAKADIIMLDNFKLEDMKTAVRLNDSRAKLEVSGNVTDAQLRNLAETGVDYISSGALTKHINAIDLSLRIC